MSFVIYQMVKQEPEDESNNVMPQIVNVASVATTIKDESIDSSGSMHQVINMADLTASIKDESANTPGGIPQMMNMASVAASIKDESSNSPGGMPQIVNVTSVAASIKEEFTHSPGGVPQVMAMYNRDGSPNAPGSMPQITNMASVAAPSSCPGNSIASPAVDGLPRANRAATESEPPVPPSAFASPAWYFFGVPGGSPNLQREVVVTCLLCKTEVRRGIRPGKLGTTCLYTHLERRHNLTREEICDIAASAGYCGPIAVPAVKTWKCSNDGKGLVLVPVKRSSASSSIDGEGGQPPKRHATSIPTGLSAPPEPSDLSRKSTAASAAAVGPPIQPYDLSKGPITTVPTISSGPTKIPDVVKNGSLTRTSIGLPETTALVKNSSFGSSETLDLTKKQASTTLLPPETFSVTRGQTISVTSSFTPPEDSLLTKGQDVDALAPSSNPSRCQAMNAPATSSSPPETPDFSSKPSKPGRRQRSGRSSRTMSTLYRQALSDRLLSSVHMYCEVCHALILSGERSQSSRDMALEAHFSSKHPHMFNRLKRGAARDVRLGGLGPASKVPSDPQPEH